VDDRLARRIAVQRGLRITGTVGILEIAAHRGLLDLPSALQKLRQTNFRIDADVIRHALERDASRRRDNPK
jgi:predicted nucleic acid-binding protein